MFIWDFVASAVLNELIDWIYAQVIGFLGNFFSEMGNMGVEIFQMGWVQSIVRFFSYLGWSLFAVGMVVAIFDCGIEYSMGRGNLKQTALSIIKGFFAVNLFTVIPVRLYTLSVSLQGSFAAGLTGRGITIGMVGNQILQRYSAVESLSDLIGQDGMIGFCTITNPIMIVFCLILMAYAVIKVFLANLKRGGILLIQISVGSLYLFGVPRGYDDGFLQWCKQIVGLCLTAFLQSTMLVAGLLVFQEHALLGLGIMLAAGEVPQIAGAFGLDTSVRANLTGAVYAAQTAATATRTILQAVPK